EVFVGAGTVEHDIPMRWRDLRNAGDVLLEVAEHLLGLAGHRMAFDAAGPAEEEHGSALLRWCQRVVDAARITIDRRVGVDLRELELGDRAAKVIEGDRRSCLHMLEDTPEELPILGGCVQPSQDLVTNVVIVAGEVEAGSFDALRWRNECLRNEQVR